MPDIRCKRCYDLWDTSEHLNCPYCARKRKARATENRAPSGHAEFELLDAIADELQKKLTEARAKHDAGEWPHKFLYAHEGVGLLHAIEIVEKYRKLAGI